MRNGFVFCLFLLFSLPFDMRLLPLLRSLRPLLRKGIGMVCSFLSFDFKNIIGFCVVLVYLSGDCYFCASLSAFASRISHSPFLSLRKVGVSCKYLRVVW